MFIKKLYYWWVFGSWDAANLQVKLDQAIKSPSKLPAESDEAVTKWLTGESFDIRNPNQPPEPK